MRTRLLCCSVSLLCCWAVLGCGRPKPGPEVPRPEEVVDFHTLYRENCSACHGAEGMNGPSYPLANPEYQALVSEPVLQDVVARGVPGTLMPAFAISAGGSLTDQQVTVIVKGMRAAWYKPGEANPPPYHSSRSGDAAHGPQVYATYCARCHGEAGQTTKSKAGSVTDPVFLKLISGQALRTVIIAGRPDIGQPDWRNDLAGHPMSDEEVTDLVAWMKKGGGAAQ